MTAETVNPENTPSSPAIYVDADACPVKAEVQRVAERHGLPVYLVSNGGMRPSGNPMVHNILVPEGPDVADDWIAERAGAGDIVITGDIPLADRVLKAGAQALNHNGKPFTPESIGMVLATRDLMTHLRETGEMTGGGRSFSKQDRSNFLQALEVAAQRAKRALE